MGNYNSENSEVLMMHTEEGGNTRMLLLHFCDDGRHEYVIGSYFQQKRHDGALGYERWDYEWYWGHYFDSFVSAATYWLSEVEGARIEQ